MANFFKKFGQGILYVITFPIYIIILAIFAVYGLFLLIIQFFKMIFNFFTGRSIHGELPEDVEARKILHKNDHVEEATSSQENNQNSSQNENQTTTPSSNGENQNANPAPKPQPETNIESVVFQDTQNNSQPAAPVSEVLPSHETQETNDVVIQDFLNNDLSNSQPAAPQTQEPTMEVYRPKTNDNYDVMEDDNQDNDDLDITFN